MEEGTRTPEGAADWHPAVRDQFAVEGQGQMRHGEGVGNMQNRITEGAADYEGELRFLGKDQADIDEKVNQYIKNRMSPDIRQASREVAGEEQAAGGLSREEYLARKSELNRQANDQVDQILKKHE